MFIYFRFIEGFWNSGLQYLKTYYGITGERYAICNSKSEYSNTRADVPPESVLRPLLFLIYIIVSSNMFKFGHVQRRYQTFPAIKEITNRCYTEYQTKKQISKWLACNKQSIKECRHNNVTAFPC